MNEDNFNPEDAKLGGLLREARSKPSLPPRFQEGVWRRIEKIEVRSDEKRGWLEALATMILRPRFALAMAVVLVAGGSLVGARQGWQAARNDAQSRYVTFVAPNSMRR